MDKVCQSNAALRGIRIDWEEIPILEGSREERENNMLRKYQMEKMKLLGVDVKTFQSAPAKKVNGVKEKKKDNVNAVMENGVKKSQVNGVVVNGVKKHDGNMAKKVNNNIMEKCKLMMMRNPKFLEFVKKNKPELYEKHMRGKYDE